MDSWLTIVPPVLAIIMAIYTRQVIPSLIVGILAGAFIIHGGILTAILETVNLITAPFADAGNTRIIVFSLLIGAVLQLVKVSGGVHAFVKLISSYSFMNSKRKASFASAIIGSLLFIESNISILTVGTIFKPIFQKLKISAEKLAYIADSTCAPMKVIIPINAWGAYLIAQVAAQGVENATSVFLNSILFFFYPIIAIVLVILTITFSMDIGDMKRAEADALIDSGVAENDFIEKKEATALFFIAPMLSLVLGVFVFMAYTGDGVLTNGSGSKSVLYAVSFALLVSFVLYLWKKSFTLSELVSESFTGMGKLLEIAAILLLAFSLNALSKELGTGAYIADLLRTNLNTGIIPVLLFVVSAFVAFSTGTSWGTFAIMLSIGLPVGLELGLHLPLIIGAVVSGGIWGDHSSPVSDTTVISSLAAGTSHISHVKTQLPYAMIGGVVSAILFIIVGFILN
jgi:Na+/H+ antiporter NhaC